MSTSVNPPVPLNAAIEMTTNWREYYGMATETDPGDAFRAFRIPLEDLEALVALARKDNTINAVRAYLALGEAVEGKILDPNLVHILLVPVADTTPTGQDILEVAAGTTTRSTIMDFTMPCPNICDFTSPLYSPLTEK